MKEMKAMLVKKKRKVIIIKQLLLSTVLPHCYAPSYFTEKFLYRLFLSPLHAPPPAQLVYVNY